MKRNITIVIIVILALGFGYFLFRISPEQGTGVPGAGSLELGEIQAVNEPRPLESGDHVLGNIDAKNTLIAYEDLQCSACASFEPILKQVAAELTDTKLVFRHYPLPSLHKNAVVAAFSAEAAAVQGKFWEYSSALYQKQRDWENLTNPIEKFAEIAGSVGISDIERFKNETENQAYKDKIEADLREALGLNLRGTPSLIFNGQLLELGSAEQIKAQAETFYK
ncbi:MAG: hypothetical protein COT92_03175 [Candidatus Doudnabacteria bacterium CG10_big_fil_rev_8_21_14_0_10_42_18]|uniref:Thioredoxin domain-containing protein n=1 Tax=Candidatus Doudnabacteria bacterium CG10_big_fil_rev_8_21_14_0_10_42_18 TaxID=1974552 RepID=A0A2H0VAC3_9BACT|nr:MAG: hypothetical protein COT92_03175 [Candidatus Doudnabacteria bacterium CG10_big_fil_rev_8_21_14_0_10_42_18]